MSNSNILNESKRITDILIKMKKSNDDLETIVNDIINEEYKKYILNIMLYISGILAENKYYIESISPFELKSYEI